MTSIRFAVSFCALAAAAACGSAQAQYARLDGALSDLIDSQVAHNARNVRVSAVDAGESSPILRARYDASNRILVDIQLDGSIGLDLFVSQLKAMGAEVTGVNPYYNQGAVSAFVPQSALSSITSAGGLRLMKLSMKPQHHVGKVTSQGAVVMRSDVANANGFTGVGVTVGVMSDSYDKSTASFTTIRAANDIASGDLPTPKFVADYTAVSASVDDEGRAMMQIVYDVAPGADLCFATADIGEASFAANIRLLRTTPACNADVIVDDVVYYDEPIFSDGQVAQAVTDVTTSTTLAGKVVSYFSSAGNESGADGGGSIDVPNAVFSTTPTRLGTVQLSTAAGCTSTPTTGSTKADVAGGWLDFGGGNFTMPLSLASGVTGTLVAQWDDPFSSGLTTDLNFYLFNASTGACVRVFADNNFSTLQPYEFISRTGTTAVPNYVLMVARTSVGAQLASRVRIVNFGGFTSTAFAASNPAIYGHTATAMANSVAAYRYSYPYSASPYTPVFEPYSSTGPVTIAFDAAGNRLPVAETRKKPDIAAPDGGDTTFFYPGDDVEPDGYNNFFGTSAAAPHAAAVAAMLIQKAGGPNSLSPKQIKTILQNTAPARVIPNSGAAAAKGWSMYDGYGLIDAVNALNKLP